MYKIELLLHKKNQRISRKENGEFTHPIGRLLSAFQESLLELRPRSRKEGFHQTSGLGQMIGCDYLDLGQVFLQG